MQISGLGIDSLEPFRLAVRCSFALGGQSAGSHLLRHASARCVVHN